MSSRPELKLDWASHAAAKYACEHWHYTRTIPAGKIVKVGVWEAGKFIGVVLFSRGANNHLNSPFGLTQLQGCELTRVALTNHAAPISRIIAVAVRLLMRCSPGLRLITSFADPLQGHHGGVYQAGGWTYVGTSQAQREVMHLGKVMHKRTAHSMFGTIKGMQASPVMWKHKYLMPLDAAMRAQIAPLAKPYPKRAKDHAAGSPPAVGGETPTRALHSEAA